MKAIVCIPLLACMCGCLHFYNPIALDPSQAKPMPGPPQILELRIKGFLATKEIAAAFGGHVAENRETIPVQIVLINHGTGTYRVLRSGMSLVDSRTSRRVGPETFSRMVDDGTWTVGWQLFLSLFYLVGMPGYVTTMNANAKVPSDYALKFFQDARLEPGQEASGALFFDPNAIHLNRREGHWKLIVEAEDMGTWRKIQLEAPLDLQRPS